MVHKLFDGEDQENSGGVIIMCSVDDSIDVRLEEVLVAAPAVGEVRDVALIGDEILRVDEPVIAVCIVRTSGGRRSVAVAAGVRKKKRTIWRDVVGAVESGTETVLMIVAAVALRKETVLDAVDYVGTCEHDEQEDETERGQRTSEGAVSVQGEVRRSGGWIHG